MPRQDSVRDILTNSSLIPYRTTPVPASPTTPTTPTGNPDQHSPGPTHHLSPQLSLSTPTTSPAGVKRNTPSFSSAESSDAESHVSKKPRRGDKRRTRTVTSTSAGTSTSTGTGTRPGHEDQLRGRQPSLTYPGSPSLRAPVRSNSPSLSLVEAAEIMLNRAEDTGGNKTTKLTRGTTLTPYNPPPSPYPVRAPPRPSSRQASEPLSTVKSLARSNSSGSQSVDSIGLTEFLQQDERPIFVLDLEVPTDDGLPIIFANTTLRNRSSLFDSVNGRSEDTTLLLDLGTPFIDFRTWALSEHDVQGISSTFPFAGMVWQTRTIRKRLRVVTGTNTQAAPPFDLGQNGTRPLLQKYHHLGSSSSSHTMRRYTSEQPTYFEAEPTTSRFLTPNSLENLVSSSISEEDPTSPLEGISDGHSTSHGDSGLHDLLATPISPREEISKKFFPAKANPESLQPMSMDFVTDKGFFDWTRLPMSLSLPEHIRFAREFDWASTSLGPIEEWPADLRGMCNLIMASPHPAAMYWGPDHVAIYNEAYVMLAGNKHPQLMGSRYADAWAEIWDVIKDVFDVAMNCAQATMKDDDCLFMLRSGFLEETYFSWSIIPLIGDDGSVVGLYNPAFEKTRRKIAERRMLTLREIGERTAAARAVSQFWSLLLEGFQYNEYDAPLVVVYSLNDGEDSDVASSTSSTAAVLKQCRLEGTLGVKAGHPCAPEFIDLKHDTKGFGAVFKQAINSERPIVLTAEDGTLDESLLQDIEWRGFGDPSRVMVIAPIRPTTGESTLGFVMMGTNPRRPYDEDYDLFVQLLCRQLATSIASVLLFEEEIKKGERAAQIAALDRMELTNQLAVRTQEAVESENKFTRMAELAPVGMYIADATGSITFANDAWYKISSYPSAQSPIGNKWINYVKDEDKDSTWKTWISMLKKKCPISMEFRFNTPWQDKFGNSNDTWVLASASPERDEDGQISRIFGSITEISSQKFAEALQRKRMEEAVSMKQQQERYIDTTSHEMRNPLSAILQSADAITGSLTELRTAEGLDASQVATVDSIIDSAQTITLCAQHQKRIVDDVLTLSKLDSAMLLVTPIDVQPEAIARRTVKMFEGESNTVDIQLNVQVDKSYRNLKIDYVRLDPTRLSQVLINLMTNAIKFTTTQQKRVIKMHVAASREKPSQEAHYNLTYIPSQTPKDKDVTASAEWGLGEPIYIHFAVSDTGRGLNEVEKKQLFQRFSQANPRTHVTYGGSGLGLFISRELVELQGGEIGVASESGKGSTFAFYVKGRRSSAPVSGSDDDVMDVHDKALRKTPSTTNNKSKLSQVKNAIATAEQRPTIVSPSSTASSLAKSRNDASGLRVLIVEDNLINQKVLAAQLKKLGCVVSVANHGGEAIEHIKKSKWYNHSLVPDALPIDKRTEIDVVLMDLEMPIMDGMTCARTLRSMQLSGEIVQHIPVIAVTANAREEQIKNTLEAGIDDVVSKPFRIPELVPKMRDTINRFANRRPSTVASEMDFEDVKSTTNESNGLTSTVLTEGKPES